MYLKQIELQGFKSFMDKTVIEFSRGGITGVVGPNGSGKSNISDAVKWVLGEQSPKSLRGGRMEDVIFAGTQNRKPMGFAEVSLVMNNEDKALNIEYNEVKVTRRLFRSGESEYLINGARCKLKDITMLFADTGVGRDGYSIIGQGKIDEILSTKSEDRRSVFEDAAGISKYRLRKEEAEKKLEQASQNAERVQDIITTLEEQIGPLEKQSEKAKIYLDLKYELRDIEVGVLADQIRRAQEHLSEVTEKQKDLLSEIETCDGILGKIKDENSEKTEENRQAEEALANAQSKKFSLTMDFNRLDSEINLCNEKLRTLDETNARSEKERQELDEKIASLTVKSGELDVLRNEAGEVLERASSVYEEEKKKYDGIMALLSDDAKKTESVRDEITEKKLQKTKMEGGISALEEQVKMLNNRIASFEVQKKLVAEESEKSVKEYDELQKSGENQVTVLGEANKRKEELQKKLDECIENKNKYAERISETVAELKEKTAKLSIYEEYEKNLEGYARGVKEILQLCRDNKNFGKGIYGAVSQLITVSEEYELAVETALGGNYQNIVTETEEDAKHAIEFLKANKYGRATFLPISASKAKILEASIIAELRRIPGYKGLATEVISIDGKYYDAIASLLGRTAVFDNIDSAIYASRQFGYSFTSVTTEGEILRTSGAITGGSRDGAQKSNTLGRTREIPQLKKDIDALELKLSSFSEKKNDNAGEAEELTREIFKLSGEIKKLEEKAGEFYRKTAAAKEKINFASKRIEELDSDIAAENAQIKSADEAAKSIEEDVLKIEKEINSLCDSLEELESKTARGAKVREAMLENLSGLQLDKNNAENNIARIEDDKNRISEEIKEANERKEKSISDESENSEVKKSLEDTISGNILKKSEIEKETQQVTEEIDILTEKKNRLTEELSGMLEKLTAESEKSSNLKVEEGRIENRIQKYNDEIDGCTARLWEEYELTPTKASELSGGKPVENYNATQKRIAELRNSIKALGNVNVSAIEELEAARSRCEFLKEQKKDIDESKEKALNVITEVTAVMKKQFAEQFVLIRKNFNEMFVRLFGGGRADIELADSGDVLESNIEINVQPPGKKLQNMMLLSGGERALTAIALLFGILKLRPAPFCLLDEIDSALDESNVAVYADFMQNLKSGTQFIMITHRSGSMNVTDTLYGVTMEEKGVSTVLSLKV